MLSPVIIPVAYFTLALGVVSWFSAAFPKATPHSHTAASSLVPPLLRKARYGVNLCGRSDFRAVALAAFAVVTLVMCVVATTNAACVEVKTGCFYSCSYAARWRACTDDAPMRAGAQGDLAERALAAYRGLAKARTLRRRHARVCQREVPWGLTCSTAGGLVRAGAPLSRAEGVRFRQEGVYPAGVLRRGGGGRPWFLQLFPQPSLKLPLLLSACHGYANDPKLGSNQGDLLRESEARSAVRKGGTKGGG